MSLQTTQNPNGVTPGPLSQAAVVVNVGKQVRGFIEKKTLHLPDDYSPENALKSAWLILQTVQDKSGNPALKVCSQESVANALLDMIVQGLNPAKKQCYFIVYGNTLTCQRSYFGEQALAERLNPGIEIYTDVVYEGDGFEMGKMRGRTVVTKHTSTLENQKVEKIIAAYCGIVDRATGEDLGAEVMTIEQIRKSWSMSKTYQPTGQGPHNKFPDQMCKRTVIRRRCKGIINSSSDALLMESIRRQDEDAIEAEIAEEATINGNGETLSLNPATSVEPEPVATPEPEELDMAALKTELGLNGDQFQHLEEKFAESKLPGTYTEFLLVAKTAGCTKYAQVKAHLEKMVAATDHAEEPENLQQAAGF